LLVWRWLGRREQSVGRPWEPTPRRATDRTIVRPGPGLLLRCRWGHDAGVHCCCPTTGSLSPFPRRDPITNLVCDPKSACMPGGKYLQDVVSLLVLHMPAQLKTGGPDNAMSFSRPMPSPKGVQRSKNSPVSVVRVHARGLWANLGWEARHQTRTCALSVRCTGQLARFTR